MQPVVSIQNIHHRRLLTGIKLHCLVTEAHVCEQLARGRYMKASRRRVEPRPLDYESNAITVTSVRKYITIHRTKIQHKIQWTRILSIAKCRNVYVKEYLQASIPSCTKSIKPAIKGNTPVSEIRALLTGQKHPEHLYKYCCLQTRRRYNIKSAQQLSKISACRSVI